MDAQDQAFESNEEDLSCDLDKLGFVPNSVSHHRQAKTRIALIPSQFAKTQASSRDAETSIARLKLSWQEDSPEG